MESYQYIGTRSGLVTVTAQVSVAGVVHLKDDDCAGAALGYSAYDSNIADTIQAALENSAGETTSVLGPLSFEIPTDTGSITITPTISVGLGTYEDRDSDLISDQRCTNYFSHTSRGRGSITAFANSYFLGSSYMRCSMAGQVCYGVILAEK